MGEEKYNPVFKCPACKKFAVYLYGDDHNRTTYAKNVAIISCASCAFKVKERLWDKE